MVYARGERSAGTALRMRVREEGTLRWELVIAAGEVGNGIPVRDSDPLARGGARPSRHRVVLSLCVWRMMVGGGSRKRVGPPLAVDTLIAP